MKDICLDIKEVGESTEVKYYVVYNVEGRGSNIPRIYIDKNKALEYANDKNCSGLHGMKYIAVETTITKD